MMKFLLAVLKFLLIVFLVAAVAAGVFYLVQQRGWPWWAGAAILGGLAGLTMTILFLRKWYFRRREKKFVKRIIDHDEATIQDVPLHERQRLKDLQERWNLAVTTLRESRLKRHGDPLYRLPWYMILGESNSGKSTAIASARLNSILTDAGPVTGVSATRNCDWWFFEEAVIIDTAGRYAIPLDESQDKQEWEKFLGLLSRYRRKEPLNGLVLTIPMEKILSCDQDHLHEYGLSLRQRMDELMRLLGARFPVYVLVTKSDLLFGLQGFAGLLSPESRKQALGYINNSDRVDPEDITTQTIEAVSSRLKEIRLELLRRNSSYDPSFLMFPDEIENIAPCLERFIDGAFHDNPYQETPLLRGIFFSSGRQSGITQCLSFRQLDAYETLKNELPETQEGYFLYDFFARILPRDRNLFSPILEFLRWRLLTRNLGIAAILLLLFFACGLMSLSFVNNRDVMSALTKEFPHSPKMTGELKSDIVTLAIFRDKINEVIKSNNDRLIPRVGLTASLRAEEMFKQEYCRLFEENLLKRLDDAVEKKMAQLTSETGEDIIADYIAYLVWESDMLAARLGEIPASSAANLSIPSGKAIRHATPSFLPEYAQFYHSQFSSYLQWSEKTGIFKEELTESRIWLAQMMMLKDKDIHWLVNWADNRQDIDPIRINKFWGGLTPTKDAPLVNRAFTATGYKEIKSFVDELDNAVADKKELKKRIEDFWPWYAKQYYSAWSSFAERFDEGENQLKNRADYRQMASIMDTYESPYMELLETMNEELAAIESLSSPPKWVELTKKIEMVVKQAKEESKKNSAQSSVTLKGENLLKRIAGQVDKAQMDDLESQLAAAKSFGEYIKALEAVVPAVASPESAFTFASSSMSSAAPKAGAAAPAQKAPSTDATAQLNKIIQLLDREQPVSNAVVWNLLQGPVRFLSFTITMEASEQLQKNWESEVLAQSQYIPAQQLRSKLFADGKGIVDKFISGTAKPFLVQTTSGWKPQKWHGISFPFKADFLAFLNDGSQGIQQIQPKYAVTVQTLPTSVNKNATQEPFATFLKVQCADKVQELANYNYADEHTFTWEPEKCGDTQLRIQFQDTTLVKDYPGDEGFESFLSEFRSGAKSFTPEDFPAQKDILGSLDVEQINVGFTFTGNVPVIELKNIKPVTIPDAITHPWL